MSEIKVILDSVNKREVRYKAEREDDNGPVAAVTLARGEWEARGRPNVLHVEDGERCYT